MNTTDKLAEALRNVTTAQTFEAYGNALHDARAALTAYKAAPAAPAPVPDKPHLFELWWERYMPDATQAQAWEAWTAAPRADGVGVAAPAAPAPTTDRCKHGVWAADHCYQCEKEAPASPAKDNDPRYVAAFDQLVAMGYQWEPAGHWRPPTGSAKLSRSFVSLNGKLENLPRDITKSVERALCNVRMIPVIGIGGSDKIVEIRNKE